MHRRRISKRVRFPLGDRPVRNLPTRGLRPIAEVEAPRLRYEHPGLWVEFAYRGVHEGSEAVSGTTLKTTLKTTPKTAEKILAILHQHPSASRREIAEMLGDITEDGVRYHLSKLKTEGHIRHIGPSRGGHWQIVGEDNERDR